MSYQKCFRTEIQDLDLYKVRLEKGVRLNLNESPYDMPVELKVALTEKIIKTDLNRYPLEDMLNLKKAIAKHNHVLSDQVAVANGSNVLIQALATATNLKNKGKVLIVDPSFSVYEHQAKLFGMKVIKIPLTDKFAIPVEKTLTAIKKENPNLILIANPNAPTGNLFDKEALYKIVSQAKCVTVIDEAYFPFSNETSLEWIQDFQNLFIMRTFSKAYSLAGARVGYVMGDSEMIYQLEKVLMPFCISKLSCLTIETALENPKYLDKIVKDIVTERNRIFPELQKIEKIKPYPSDANYILFKTENSERIYKGLVQKGFNIRNVSNNGLLQDCLRLTVGTKEENNGLLKAIKEVVG